MKTCISFLLSFNAHVWVVWLFSLLSEPPDRQAIEFTLIRLPAPREGAAASASLESERERRVSEEPLPPADKAPEKSLSAVNPLRRQESVSPAVETPAESPAALRERLLTRKENRRLVEAGPTPIDAQAEARKTSAPPKVLMRVTARPEPLGRETERRPFHEQHRPPEPKEPIKTVVFERLPQKARTAAALSLSQLGGRSPTLAKNDEAVDSVSPERPAAQARLRLPTADVGRFSPGTLDAGGDTRPLLDIIQARIDAVTPLVHRTSGSCKFLHGEARLSFRMNRFGYHEDHRLLKSAGQRCLDERIEEVLHLAEPYPYLAGWVPVYVRF